VIHENTDHHHVHVVVLGRDADDRLVRIDKMDHMRMRAYGDRFLEREHQMERVMDRDMERFCRERGLNIMYDSERGAEFYKLLGERKGKDSERDRREFELFDEKWKEILERPEFEQQARLGASTFHLIGRQADYRELLNNRQQQEVWEGVRDNDPTMELFAQQRLAQVDAERGVIVEAIKDRTQVQDPWKVIDTVAAELSIEARELNRLLSPDSLEPRTWDRDDIDMDRLREKDKIELQDGTILTKWDDKESLLAMDRTFKESAENRIPKEDYQRLWNWIGSKERFGEDVFGEPPLKDREHEVIEKALETEQPERVISLEELSINAAIDDRALQELLQKDPEKTELETASVLHGSVGLLEREPSMDEGLERTLTDDHLERSWDIDASNIHVELAPEPPQESERESDSRPRGDDDERESKSSTLLDF
jgi:hypothetical protein